MINAVRAKLKAEGIGGLLASVSRRLASRQLRYFPNCKPLFQAGVGLEIGGPSGIFGPGGVIPIYPVAKQIDNVNFAHQTIWEGAITEGETFVFNKGTAPGHQYVGEASNLEFIQNSTYDFVLSSHCIEHLANPIQGLTEWVRVLKQDGLLILVVPHKDGTFDHRRPVTPLDHLIQDFNDHTDEGDMTHVEEILKLHDLTRHPGTIDLQSFQESAKQNKVFRYLHHHVFDTRSVIELVNYMGLQILAVELFSPYHIAILSRKVPQDQTVDNEKFRGRGQAPSWRSPFPSDRTAKKA